MYVTIGQESYTADDAITKQTWTADFGQFSTSGNVMRTSWK